MSIETFCTGLSRNRDGIWYASTRPEVSYPKDGNDQCFQIEDGSFWFRHHNRCIISVMENYPPNGKIFDIGGGNGFVSRGMIEAGFDVALVEPGYQGALNSAKRGIKTVICAAADLVHFNRSTLPAIGLFDVVEHVQDDLTFMTGMHDLLMDHGLVYLTVPAHPFLWSAEDEAAGHFRRYSSSQTVALLEASSFRVLYCTYIFQALLLPIFLFRALPLRLGYRKQSIQETSARDHASKGGMGHTIITKLLNYELPAIRASRSITSGTSCLLVAQKVGRAL